MNYAAWSPLLIAIAIFTLWCLWHLVSHNVEFMPKWAWALIIVCAPPLGGLVYLLVSVLHVGEYRDDAEGRRHDA